MNKSQLFDAISLKIEPLKIGAKTIYVRELTGAEMLEYENAVNKDGSIESNLDDMALFCTYTVCNKDGKRILSADDAKELIKKSFTFIEKASTAGMKVNNMGSQEVEEIKKK